MSISGIHNLDILRGESMTDFVRKVPSGGPEWFYENLFANNKKNTGNFDVVKWDEVSRTRRRAPFQVRGAPAQRQDLLNRQTRTASVLDIFISKQLDASQIENLRVMGQEGGDGARAMINDELTDMVETVQRTREHACFSVAQGSFSSDQTASATNVKSRGSKFALTFPVTAMTAGTNWATTSTNIYTTELQAVINKAQEIAGYTPTRAIHNSDLMMSLLTNTEIKSFLGEQYKTQLLKSGRITQVRNIDFLPYDTGDDDGGSWAKYLAADKVLFLPPDNRYFDLLEAPSMIPTPDGNDLQRISPGIYSYSKVTYNPVGIELFVGYRFLPVNRYAERTIVLDTTP